MKYVTIPSKVESSYNDPYRSRMGVTRRTISSDGTASPPQSYHCLPRASCKCFSAQQMTMDAEDSSPSSLRAIGYDRYSPYPRFGHSVLSHPILAHSHPPPLRIGIDDHLSYDRRKPMSDCTQTRYPRKLWWSSSKIPWLFQFVGRGDCAKKIR